MLQRSRLAYLKLRRLALVPARESDVEPLPTGLPRLLTEAGDSLITEGEDHFVIEGP